METSLSQPQFLDLSKYRNVSLIGKGEFGDVYLIKSNQEDESFAAKISKFMVDEETKDNEKTLFLFRELTILSLLNHPSILKFVGYSPFNFENYSCPTIVTEYAINGSLQSLIDKENSGLSPTNWDFTKKLICIYGIASGMSYLHEHDIIHRDLKPDNILLDEFLHPKIGDFGLSKMTSALSLSIKVVSQKGIKGTPLYMAPESLSEENYTKEGDVYSFGVLVNTLLTGQNPDLNTKNLFALIRKVKEGERPPIGSDVAEVYQDLIKKCWDQEPKNRPTFKEIVDELGKSKDYLIPLVDEDEFTEYVEYINEFKATFDISKRSIHFADFIKSRKKCIDYDLSSDSESDVAQIELEKPRKNYFQQHQKESKNDESVKPLIANQIQCLIPPPLNDQKLLPFQVHNQVQCLIPPPLNDQKLLPLQIHNQIPSLRPKVPVPNSNQQLPQPAQPAKNLPQMLLPIQIQGFNLKNNQNKKNDASLSATKIQKNEKIEEENINQLLPQQKVHDFSSNLQKVEEIHKVQEIQKVEEMQKIEEKLQTTSKLEKQATRAFQGKNELEQNNQIDKKSSQLHEANKQEPYVNVISHEPKEQSSQLLNQSMNSAIKSVQQLSQNVETKKNDLNQLHTDENQKKDHYNGATSHEQQRGIQHSQNNIEKGENNQNLLQPDEKQDEDSYNDALSHVCTEQDMIQLLNQEKEFLQKEPNVLFFSFYKFNELDESCKALVREAKNNPERQLLIARSLIKGENNFPVDIQIGLKYLHKSIESEFIDAIVFYINMLIKGDIYGQDLSKAKKMITQKFKSKDGNYYVLHGKISKKQKHYQNALKYFEKGFKIGDSESIYQYAKMFFFGLGTKKNDSEAFKYFFISKNNGHQKSQLFLTASQKMNSIPGFKNLFSETQSFLISSVAKICAHNTNEFHNMNFDTIKIPAEKTEAFFVNNSLQSPIFINCLQCFKNIIFYIQYPSKMYNPISELITKIQQIKLPNIKIEIFVVSFDQLLSDFKSITISPQLHEIVNDAFNKCSQLKKITIPHSITKIGKNAFNMCSSIRSISIPSTVTQIKKSAFTKCKSLKQLIIPSSVATIESSAFENCTELKQVLFDSPSNLREIDSSLFNACESLLFMVIPDSVTSIGTYAFCDCISLQSVEIPSSVKLIKEGSFCNCKSLKSVEIPFAVTMIEKKAFCKCSSISQIEIKCKITTIEESVFEKCLKLKKVSILSPVTKIGSCAFKECEQMEEISLSSTLTEIANDAFTECHSIAKIPESKISSSQSKKQMISDYKFSPSFEQIITPPLLTEISESACYQYIQLKSVFILSSVTSINKEAFFGCTSLNKVIFQQNSKLLSIGQSAFYGCTSLNRIDIPSSVTEIGHYAFYKCDSLLKVWVDVSMTSIGCSAFPMNTLVLYKNSNDI